MNILNLKGALVSVPSDKNGFTEESIKALYSNRIASYELSDIASKITPYIIGDYPDSKTQTNTLEITDNLVILTETEYNNLISNK